MIIRSNAEENIDNIPIFLFALITVVSSLYFTKKNNRQYIGIIYMCKVYNFKSYVKYWTIEIRNWQSGLILYLVLCLPRVQCYIRLNYEYLVKNLCQIYTCA